MKVGVIGLGYWGPNLIRNFLGNPEISDVIGCDINESRLKLIAQRFPGIKLTNSFEEILNGYNVDIVCIALPVRMHYEVAKKALINGKHIWVEKPFTSNTKEAEDLINIAEKKNLKIFVDHTFIYTGAVRKIHELVENNSLGDIIYYDSVRINLGLFQNDVNVIWDLAAHDLSIMNYIIKNKKVVGVCANGIANYYQHENVAHISVYFDNNCFAHFHVNWTSPVKIRKILIGGTKKMLVFDDIESSEKIKVYDSGVNLTNKDDIYNALIQYRIGDMYSPRVDQTEALFLGVNEFIASIKENRQPLTNGYDGLKVIQILEAADYSIKNKGKFVEIK